MSAPVCAHQRQGRAHGDPTVVGGSPTEGRNSVISTDLFKCVMLGQWGGAKVLQSGAERCEVGVKKVENNF